MCVCVDITLHHIIEIFYMSVCVQDMYLFLYIDLCVTKSVHIHLSSMCACVHIQSSKYTYVSTYAAHVYMCAHTHRFSCAHITHTHVDILT